MICVDFPYSLKWSFNSTEKTRMRLEWDSKETLRSSSRISGNDYSYTNSVCAVSSQHEDRRMLCSELQEFFYLPLMLGACNFLWHLHVFCTLRYFFLTLRRKRTREQCKAFEQITFWQEFFSCAWFCCLMVKWRQKMLNLCTQQQQ